MPICRAPLCLCSCPRPAADAEHDPAADTLLQPAPAFEFHQRIAW
jgi:hypothetical protein